MTPLSKSFSVEEFLLGKELNPEEVNKAYLFCLFILEPVRIRFGITKITNFKRTDADTQRLLESGYSPSLSSQHLQCEAVDFTVLNTSLKEVYSFLCNEINWPGQIELDLVKLHIHVGWPRIGISPNRFIRAEASSV